MSEKIKLSNTIKETVQTKASSESVNNESTKKTFIEPEIKEYPSLKDVTLLTVPAVSGATFFKTFK